MKNSTLAPILLLTVICQATFGQSSVVFQHPKDQIAMQLGAIQMGYAVPFILVSKNATNAQQAANALAMGRYALDATVAKPTTKVQGAVNSPAVDTVEFRDQLYQAVEAVITSPVTGSVRGIVTLQGGKKQSVSTFLTVPPNSHTIPVPYAVEAATSVDAQAQVVQIADLQARATQVETTLTEANAAMSANLTALQTQNTALSGNLTSMISRFRVIELKGPEESSQLDFGNSTTEQHFEIGNSGFDRLTVSRLEFPPGFSGELEPLESGAIVYPSHNPMGTGWVRVKFEPAQLGDYGGEIVVHSDATGGTNKIPVRGVGSRLLAVEGPLVFGSATANFTHQRNIVISNIGTMPLSVTGVSLPEGFSGNWSGTLTPGASQEVKIHFTPMELKAYGGNLSVFSDAVGGSSSLAISGEGESVPSGMVAVQGGTLPQISIFAGQQVATFYIGKYEVTWAEWQEVRGWAVENGYTDLDGVGEGSAGDHPVRNVNCYDVLKWCNAKSERDGFNPVYYVNGKIYRTGYVGWVGSNYSNGYRLPRESEWEWAARGGVASQGLLFSGSNDVNEVAWYLDNSSGDTKSVGLKLANEIGINDMSGNVWEWCYEWNYIIRGGSWGNVPESCTVSYRVYYQGSIYAGFRLARSTGVMP
jgi:hypothetical protein